MTNAQTNDLDIVDLDIPLSLFLKDWLKSFVACVRPPMTTSSSHQKDTNTLA